MSRNSSLIDWCNTAARPVLEAVAAGQPAAFSARQALLRLEALLDDRSGHGDVGKVSDERQWGRLCKAIDDHPEAYGSFVVALSYGPDALKILVDTLVPRAL